MHIDILIGLASIIFFGILAQWISWKFRLPSILLLLIFGFLAGPVFGFVRPDAYFGDLLFPIVSISVAVILFEGGMSLQIRELKTVGGVVRNLISIGIIVTWILASLGAYYIAGLDISLAVLLGAILVVTGPTVILPILRFVRPTGQVNSVLKWEGIINDPIGALLAILVFEVILTTSIAEATAQVAMGLLKTVLLSSTIGLIGAIIIVLLIKYDLVPDFLQNSISLAMVIVVFAGSNAVQTESGLFAVTIMGIALANQKSVTVKHIIEFKENLRVLLISVLFILLAARLNVADLSLLDFNSIIFVLFLIIIVRPLAVFLSSINSPLNWKEKIYLSWMAPRGIVAAAVTSLFALELVERGYESAASLVPIMFLVIVATIAVYGLSAIPLARWLGIANPNQQGVLILGAHTFAREIGKKLKENGIKVQLVDTNYHNVSAARNLNLPAHNGSILSESIVDELDLSGIGKLIAITPNREVNSLAALYFLKIFGSNNVYQLSIGDSSEGDKKKLSKELRGQILFNDNASFKSLSKMLDNGWEISATSITEKFSYAALKSKLDKNFLPLLLIKEGDEVEVYTNKRKPEPKPGSIVISLAKKGESDKIFDKQDKLA